MSAADAVWNAALDKAAEIVTDCGHISANLAASRILAIKLSGPPNLFDAAPDLLAALESVRRDIDAGLPCDGRTIGRVERAIANARGIAHPAPPTPVDRTRAALKTLLDAYVQLATEGLPYMAQFRLPEQWPEVIEARAVLGYVAEKTHSGKGPP